MSPQTDLAHSQNFSLASSVENVSHQNSDPVAKGKGKEKEVTPPEPSDTSSASVERHLNDGRDPLGAGRWPLEHFPAPPPDGNWQPKDGRNPATKMPPKRTGAPQPPNATLNPPLMALTFPPPSPLSERDPSWLKQMLGDVQRQRSHLEIQLALAQAEATEALVDATLANTELSQEMRAMQGFLDRVANVAGPGFVRRLVSQIDHMTRHFDDENQEGEEEVELVNDDENDDADEEDELDSEETSTSNEEDSNDSSSSDQENCKPGDSKGPPPPPGGSGVRSSTGETQQSSASSEPEPEGGRTSMTSFVEGPNRLTSEDDVQPLAANPSLPSGQLENNAAASSSSSASDAASVGEPFVDASSLPTVRSNERFLAKVLAEPQEPLNVDAAVSRQSRVVRPINRIVGVRSFTFYEKECRKRVLLYDDSDEESEDVNSGQEMTESPKKRAKTAHQPSPSPPRKRSCEALLSDGADDSELELDSEEEVSVQVTPRVARDQSLVQAGTLKAAGKCKAEGSEDDSDSQSGDLVTHAGRRSPKRIRHDGVSVSISAPSPGGGWLNWLMGSSPFRQAEASGSTSSQPQSSVRRRRSGRTYPDFHQAEKCVSTPLHPQSSLRRQTPPRNERSTSPPPSPSLSLAVVQPRAGPPNEPSAPSNSNTAVGRRRPRPLRRDPWRLRENAFGEPVLYRVSESP